MSENAKRFKVALVGLDDQQVPDWVVEKFERENIDFAYKECETREDLAAIAGDAEIVWVFGSHKVVYAENLDLIPQCGAIIRTGSGTDNIPVAEVTERGIVVANTPDAITDAVAEHAIALLFAVMRHVVVQDRAVRRGVWDRNLALPTGLFQGKRLGLVGFGRIPRAVVRKLNGFEPEVQAYDPYVDPGLAQELDVELVQLDEVMSRSDFVSIHCPLLEETRHLIGERELRLMKPEAIFINTARGPVVDEAAVLRALRENWIAGAGLDVLEEEPPDPANPILQLDNAVVNPHIAGYWEGGNEQFWQQSVEAAIDLAKGHWPRSYVNPGVEPRWKLR